MISTCHTAGVKVIAGTLSFSSHYIVILMIMMIRHHLQSHGWDRQRNWCSWKHFHTLCISRYLYGSGSLKEISFPFFRYMILFLKFVVNRIFTTATLSPVTKLSTMITVLKFKHVNCPILLSMYQLSFFFCFGVGF